MAGRAVTKRTSASARDVRPVADKGHQRDARADQRRDAVREDRLLSAIYDQGIADARAQRRAATRSRAGAAVQRRATRTGRGIARNIAVPTGRAPSGWVGFAGMFLGLIVLYLVLTNAKTYAAVIGGVTRGVGWVTDPNRSIPYAT